MALFNKKPKAADPASLEAGLAAPNAGPIEPEIGYPQPFMPSLSLVPQSRLTVLKRRKTGKKALAAVLGTFAVVAAAIVGLVVTLLGASALEGQAEARLAEAEAEYATMSPVADLYNGFEQRQTAVGNALASDVDFYRLITSVQDAIQAEIPRDALMEDAGGQWYVKADYAHVGLTGYSISDEACPTEQPFDPGQALGCISGTANATSYTAAGEAMKALNDAANGLFGAYVLTAADVESDSAVGHTTFTFTVNFDAGALSGKYADETQAILGGGPLVSETPATTEPTPAPTAIAEGEN